MIKMVVDAQSLPKVLAEVLVKTQSFRLEHLANMIFVFRTKGEAHHFIGDDSILMFHRPD